MGTSDQSHLNGLHLIDDKILGFGGIDAASTPDVTMYWDSATSKMIMPAATGYYAGGSAYLPIQMGDSSSTDATKGIYVSAANPRILDMHASDGDAAIAQGTSIGVSRSRLMRYKSGLIIEEYASDGMLKMASGITKGAWGAGVIGRFETAGAFTLAGQGEDTVAGLWGRIGLSANVTCADTTARLAAICAFANTNAASATSVGSAKYVGLLVRDGFVNGVTFMDFDYGIEIYPSVANIGIYVGACDGTGIEVGGAATSGLIVSGATTNAISITGTATTAIRVLTGTFGTGISLAGTLTTGLSIAACTTAISVTGATTNAISITGTATTAITVLTGTFGTGISLAGTLTTGITIAACTTGLSISGATTNAISITGTATAAITILTGTFGTGVSIAGTLTTGISIGASTTAISIAGAAGTGINFAVAPTSKGIDMIGAATYLAIEIGTFDSNAGNNGIVVNNTVRRAVDVLCDDNGAGTAGAEFISAGRFRLLGTKAGAYLGEQYTLQGVMKYVGSTISSYAAGGLFTNEWTTSYTVNGYAAGCFARIGGDVAPAIGSGGIIAGFLSVHNFTSGNAHTGAGVTAAFAAILASTGNWDYGLYIPNSSCSMAGVGIGTCPVGVDLTGTFTVGVDGSGSTIAPDASRTNSFISFGNRTLEKDITLATTGVAQHLDPIQMNLNVIGANPGVDSTFNGIYQLLTHDTAAMANLRLKGADWNIVVGQNVKDAYVYQGELDFTGSSTVGGEACAMGLTVNASAGTVAGNIWGAIISMDGASMPAATSAALFLSCRTSIAKALYLEANSGKTVTAGIFVNAAGTFTHLISASGTITNFMNLTGGASFYTTSGTVCTGWQGRIKILDEAGVAGYINVYDTANA